MYNKKLLIIAAVVVVAVGAGAFYGGFKYGASSQNASRVLGGGARSLGVGAGFPPAGPTGAARGGQLGQRSSGGAVTGEIVSKDGKSITLKIYDSRLPAGQGGSKIIFYSATTEISKMASGTIDDLAAGKTIMVTGKANPDGSIIAESIQARP